jgi:hypothetical protein
MIPITISECPPIYFVTELTLISIPNNKGDCRNGLLKVLSHTVIILCSFAILEIASKSIILRVGFIGVSSQINFVFSFIDFFKF